MVNEKLLLATGLLPLLATSSPVLEPRQAGTTITLDTATRYQTIDGFGFSEAFQRANGIVNLPEPKRTEVVDLLYNTTTGAGLTILRIGIGSSPNSTKDWMNTILPVGPSSPAGVPSYVWDAKDSGQLWVAQQGLKYGVKTFYADAWSAPGFMKTNGRDSGGGYLCGSPGNTCATGDWRQAYADYLVKYIQFYGQEGVNITHIGFLNEPDYSTSYASMQMNGPQAADFIKVLSPALKKASLGTVQIACCEATGYAAQAAMTPALNTVADLMGIVTQHEYTSRITGPQPTTLKVWETEYADLSGGWSTDWYRTGGAGDGLTWAQTIHNGLTVGNLSAYLYWEGTQDRATNNNNNEKLILVEDTTYTVAKRLWAFAQYSRAVRPGAVRVAATGGGAGLKTTAFVNLDGSVAVVSINNGAAAAALTIAGGKGTSAKAWVSDNTHDMEVTPSTVGADGSVTGVTVPARGMVTVVITPVA